MNNIIYKEYNFPERYKIEEIISKKDYNSLEKLRESINESYKDYDLIHLVSRMTAREHDANQEKTDEFLSKIRRDYIPGDISPRDRKKTCIAD